VIIGVDANLSVRIVGALNALYATPSLQFVQVGSGKADSDAPWIDEFAKNKGIGFIGADKAILSRPNEVHALIDSGLYAFFLNFGKAQPRIHVLASHVIRWWPAFQSRIGSEYRVYRTPVTNTQFDKLEGLRVEVKDGVRRVVRI
jgi:hypothetical protein